MIEGQPQYCLLCGTELITKLHTGKDRPACPNCGWVYFPDPKVAVVVLVKKEDQVLLTQRRFDPQKGYWTLPGGFVDAGEDPKLAAGRECLEETGLVVGDLELLDVLFTQENPRGASILILYQGAIKSGTINPGDDVTDASFFQFQALPHLAFSSTTQILRSYI